MTKKSKFVSFALPKSRIRAFAINPESAQKVFGQTATPKTISETRSRAQQFRTNNLGETRLTLIKK